MELFKYLLIIWCLCRYVESFQLSCLFLVEKEEGTCKVETLNVFETDVAVTSVSGHNATLVVPNDKIVWFLIEKNVETENVPTKVCDFFQNLRHIWIHGYEIKRIKREVFTNCKKLIVIDICFTSLTILPEDLFMDLSELKAVWLQHNKLVSLPADLVLNNRKLNSFTACNNELQTIDTVLPSQMAIVDFRNNICIDKKFPDDIADLILFKNEVASKCDGLMDKEKTRTIDSGIVALDTNIEQQNSTIESPEIALAEKETNVSKLEKELFNCNQNKLLQANLTQNDNFKANETIVSLEKCLKDLSTFNELNEETGILKKKLETFERENLVLLTNITQLISTIQILKNEIEVLQTDITADRLELEAENQRLKSNYEDLMKTVANIMKPV